MDHQDQPTFDRAFRRLVGAFRLRLSAGQLAELSTTYFRVLEGYPLDRALFVGKQLLETYTRMPYPAEWLSACARPDAPAGAPDAHQRWMTTSELDERAQADAWKYAAAPCACRDCLDAGVSDQPLRYVPTDLDATTYETAWDSRRGVVQIAGHWAHGDELARWYAARRACFAHAHRRGIPLRRVLERDDDGGAVLVSVSREPGEEG
jgi:hypothetical protein